MTESELIPEGCVGEVQIKRALSPPASKHWYCRDITATAGREGGHMNLA